MGSVVQYSLLFSNPCEFNMDSFFLLFVFHYYYFVLFFSNFLVNFSFEREIIKFLVLLCIRDDSVEKLQLKAFENYNPRPFLRLMKL